MQEVTVFGKVFEKAIAYEDIQLRVAKLAAAINQDFKDEKPIFVGVLNGSFYFMTDLLRNITLDCQVSFAKVASYEDMESTGELETLIGIKEDLEGQSVVLVEDIVDTGFTMLKLLEDIRNRKPKKLRLAALLSKPQALQTDVTIDYTGFEVSNEFLVGYGLDYNGYGRQYKDIYRLKSTNI